MSAGKMCSKPKPQLDCVLISLTSTWESVLDIHSLSEDQLNHNAMK